MRLRARGAALVLVLWLIALMTALVGAFALSARTEHLQQRVLDTDARGQEQARAGLEYALSRLRPDPQRPAWQADGRRYRWQFEEAQVEIRILDEEGKINLNRADPVLLEAFLRAMGEPQETARQLAGAIIDWRDTDDLVQAGGGAEAPDYAAAGLPYGPSNQNFETLGELQRVLGMRAALFQKMLPYITLYSRGVRPDPRVAEGPVLTALGLDAEQVLAQRAQLQADEDPTAAPKTYASGSGTYSIESRAIDGSGRASVLRAVVRSGSGGQLGRTYQVLRWEQGMAAR
ncbi:type II secretion system protein GspK [Stenotrophomonas sp. 24(2023)]|uniref:general secretion pathway protein GspK n=1 Tax=Stenotrophomonas sp. 24(2023) TaxID=3068324 RepID=UPI0027DECC85|nr:type II secretion system protein GspK [Stenotrophomonas sp. 24(2023)]WMJ67783.1 type II secretion system protein GspK [Stenotrophomonas sp. 24(2023)]